MARFYVPSFKTIPGEYYYVVDCPLTGQPIPFEHDASRGRTPYPKGPLIVSCSHCQGDHEILSPEVTSHQALQKA